MKWTPKGIWGEVLRDSGAAPGGGPGTESSGPTIPGPGPEGGAPPGPAKAEPSPTPAAGPKPADAGAGRRSAYDRYALSDEARARSDALLDQFSELDAAQQAEIIAEAQRSYARRQADAGEPGKTKPPARSSPAPDEDDADPAETPQDRSLRELRARLDRLEREDQQRSQQKELQRQTRAWREEVSAAIKGDPALADLVESEDDVAELADQAMGYVAARLPSHGGSRGKALKGWMDAEKKLMAKAQGKSVQEFLEGKLRQRTAQGEQGGGRAPAQTTRELTADDLRRGNVLAESLAELGLDGPGR